MSGTLAPQVHDKAPTEVRNIGVDFTDDLALAELLLQSSTPTVTSDLTGLTFGTPTVLTVATTISGRLVAVGKGILCSVSGGTEDDDHLLTVTCGTDSTPAQTVVGTCRLRIRK